MLHEIRPWMRSSNSRFVAAISKSRALCYENALRDYEIAATTRRIFP
jgi:hypothetical protein